MILLYNFLKDIGPKTIPACIILNHYFTHISTARVSYGD